MELVAFLGKDEENWGQISAIIKRKEWDKVILVANKSVDIGAFKEYEIVKIDSEKSMIDLKDDLTGKLKSKLAGEFEVALSIASGNGKEHMALISALLNLPVGIKIVVYTKNGVEFIS